MSIAKALDTAVSALNKIGLTLKAEPDAPVVAVISQIAELGQDDATAIARTLQQASAFNDMVRSEIGQMTIANRYESIASDFNSIRDDAKSMVGYVDDGRVDWKEKAAMTWMRITRGSIPDRFDDIRKTYLTVAKDCKEQIDREKNILFAYQEFRVAMKESEVASQRLLKTADDKLAAAKAGLQNAQAAVDAGDRSQGEAFAKLELARDQAMRALQDEDRRYQVAKDLADNIKASYAAGEVVMARLLQTTAVKERVYQQAVTFFSTNETVFTALSAAFTSLQGLHEGTQTLNAMKDGVNKGLESIADLGTEIQIEGLKAGYGPGLAVDSVRKLVDAVVDFQARSFETIKEMRALSTKNATEIAETVEAGKKRLNDLVTHQAAQ
ncbi:cell surface protein [Permianibacter sp. IMCC34836]|uniref:cell surface protein n=1 Tax=Permianibacter fluminis TaxID=2738515 RepID=UPI0015577D1D|nr:cell surface protein [Permianibacter fluminis]NQD36957.1 cell surface protein [Permianibacter fluminis]